jgi:hypothetical protein
MHRDREELVYSSGNANRPSYIKTVLWLPDDCGRFGDAAAVAVTRPFCDVPVEEQFSPRRLNV